MKFEFDKSGTSEGFREVCRKVMSESKGILLLTCIENHFSSDWFEDDMTDSFPLFGGIFPQVIYGRELFSRGSVLIGFDTKPKIRSFDLRETRADKLKEDIDKNIESAFPQTENYKDKTLFVFIDSSLKNIDMFIKRIFFYFGMEPNYIGGGAGKIRPEENNTESFPCIISHGKIRADSAIVAVADVKTGIGVGHGWKETPYSFMITKTKNNDVISLDWNPAGTHFHNIVSQIKKTDAELTIDDYREYPWGIKKWESGGSGSEKTGTIKNIAASLFKNPFKIREIFRKNVGSETLVRTPFYLREDDKIGLVGGIEERVLATVLKSDSKLIIRGAETAFRIAENTFGKGTNYEGIFFMDCVSRPRILTERDFRKELKAVSRKNIPLVGATAFGEIGNTGKRYLEYYNKTAVVGIFGDSSAKFRDLPDEILQKDIQEVTKEERGEIAALLHAISISINPDLNSDILLEQALHSYMSRLNLTYCGIYQIEGDNIRGNPIKHFPKISQKENTLNAAISALENLLLTEGGKCLLKPIISEKRVPKGGFYHILEFPRVGVMILATIEKRLGDYLINHLSYINEQLANSYYASKNRETIKKQKNELKKAGNYIYNIINSMPSLLISVDTEGRVTQWNKTAENVTGITAGAARGQPLPDVYPRMASEMRKIGESIRNLKTQQERKKPWPSEGGGFSYEDVTIYPIIANDAEGAEGAVIRVDDVTEQVRSEEIMVRSEKMQGEMELARNIQTCLLPTSLENIHPDFEISAAMVTADEVGGDFYEITPDRSGNLWFAVGDVSGHGVTPGLIMMMAQTIHATVTANLDCEARDVVVKINEILYANVHERLKESHFMTFNALRYLGLGKFEHAGAHLRIVVFRRESDDCELIPTKGVYLNFKKDISKATKNSYFELGEGDIMILYTDGLTEAENPDGEMLDIDGFVEIVEKHARQEPEAMKESIMADVLRWCDDRRDDDMTLVIVKRKN